VFPDYGDDCLSVQHSECPKVGGMTNFRALDTGTWVFIYYIIVPYLEEQ